MISGDWTICMSSFYQRTTLYKSQVSLFLSDLSHCSHLLLILLGMGIASLIQVTTYSNSHAIPIQEYKRLAVLELQGEPGSVQQKQVWTDQVRAIALRLLKDKEILVIDRDQFKVLLDPNRQLNDCIGLCAAELARELGAHWSLSGQLSKLLVSKAQQNTHKSRFNLTLKLHDASGALLAVQQRSFSKLLHIHKYLAQMTNALIKQGLLPMLNDHVLNHINELDDEKGHPDANLDHTLQDEKDVNLPIKYGLDRFTLIKTEAGSLCVSPLVKVSEYESCVAQGQCTVRPTWGNCRAKADEPVRCINLQQALLYSRWSSSNLPSLKELKVLFAQEDLRQEFFEWIRPLPDRSSQAFKAWQDSILDLDPQKLKSYPKQTVAQTMDKQRGLSDISTKSYPPAFQVSQLSFRVLTKDLDSCRKP